MKIDIFAHICPKKFIDYCSKHVANWGKIEQSAWPSRWPTLWDIDKRLAIMDRYEGYSQVLVSPGGMPALSCSSKVAINLAQIYNDATAELVSKYPDRFVAAVAYLPLNDIDASLKEMDRAINGLGLKGICLNTPIFEVADSDYDYRTMRPIDSPEFLPIYQSLSKYDLPIWIHPQGQGGVPVYLGEKRGKYGLSEIFGWPLESAMAMGRLVCSGILSRYPNLKFIIHHCGSGIVPVLAGRIDGQIDTCKALGMKWGQPGEENPFEKRAPTHYFKMFYADTALYGDTNGLMCGYAFFGAERMLFGTDFPFDTEGGDKYIRKTIDATQRMEISDADKMRIFEHNAKRILGLETNE